MDDLLARLPEAEQTALRLLYEGRLRFEEIAERMQLSVLKVQRLVANGLNGIAQWLEHG